MQTSEIVPASQLTPLKLDRHQSIILDNQEDLVRFCRGLVVSKQAPKKYWVTDNPKYGPTDIGDASMRLVFAWQFLAALRVPPFPWLRFFAMVEGQPMIYGDLPLALTNQNKRLAVPPEEFCVTESGERIGLAQGNLSAPAFAAICRMTAAGTDLVTERFFTVEQARRMGKMPDARGKGVSDRWHTTPWARHPERMLQMRARSHCIKDLCPEVLNGAPIVEYDARGDLSKQEVPELFAGKARVVEAKVAPSTPPPSRAVDLDALFPEDG